MGRQASRILVVGALVAASAVAGLVGKEGLIIRKTFFGFLYYALLPGSIGYAIVWWSQKGLLNVGTMLALIIWVFAVGLIVKANRRPLPILKS